MPGIRHTTNADGSFTTDGASAWNGEEAHTLSDVASQTSLDAVSAAVDVVSNNLSALNVSYQSLVNRVSANSGTGGGGSVTSNEVSAIAAGLSTRVDSVANAVSIVSQALSVTVDRLANLSAQVTSADNAINNAVSIVSVAAANALSVGNDARSIANAASNKASALSVQIAANSAQMTSADNAISNAVSVVSVAAANALSVANAASNKASALSVQIAANSAQMTSADNAISNAVSIVSVAAANALSVANDARSIANAVSNRLSGLQLNSLADVSTNAVTNGQVLAWDSAQAQWIPATPSGGTVSVTSAEFQSLVDRVSANSGTGGGGSVTSAEVQSIANNVSDLRSDHIVMSDKLSLRAPWLAAQIRILSNNKSTAVSTMTDISGLVLTVAADETWQIEGQAYFSTSATTVGLRLGASVPPLSLPRYFNILRTSGAQSAGVIGGGGLMQVSGSSANVSVAGVGPAGGAFPVSFNYMFNVASAGTFRLQYAAIASATASPMHVLAGSYFKAFRVK